ncbi:MAG: phosphoadenylyl-sulfate reductase [Spirochaetales bacterium]|nr:phosphoadenylyl-sulfate reductase [Spirochaetales bacterium]
MVSPLKKSSERTLVGKTLANCVRSISFKHVVPADLQELKQALSGLSAEEILIAIAKRFGAGAVFSTSFGAEDQVLTQMIRSLTPTTGIFALDTGRHFEETYYTMAMTVSRYGPIDTFSPEAADIENLLKKKGPLSFYESVENRKECCFLRKVKPLQRALIGKSCWISGIRREQSPSRNSFDIAEWDEDHQLIKVYPLLEWTTEEIWNYIKEKEIPYNELHDRNFPSIGCAPCTRAIKPGEALRAGRWWWEQSDQECGLHVTTIRSLEKPANPS